MTFSSTRKRQILTKYKVLYFNNHSNARMLNQASLPLEILPSYYERSLDGKQLKPKRHTSRPGMQLVATSLTINELTLEFKGTRIYSFWDQI